MEKILGRNKRNMKKKVSECILVLQKKKEQKTNIDNKRHK